ncbi:MAG: hypothetical protein E6Q97_33950 [Desulfurellales bacterium]|jgi:hypothetical protein|nr:MAG: hypothetical protein E6Q97_33950 [Desulfurellales bacterium]
MPYQDPNNAKGLFPPQLPSNPLELERLRRKNNPHNKPVGDYTGRCRYCGSCDLWEDNLHYGCNVCQALLG